MLEAFVQAAPISALLPVHMGMNAGREMQAALYHLLPKGKKQSLEDRPSFFHVKEGLTV